MNEPRVEGGLSKLNGGAQRFLGGLTGDGKLQLQGRLDQARGSLLTGFGRAVDVLEKQIDRAPADLQPRARQAVSVARNRPVATMLGLAAVGFLLTRVGGRRR